MYKVYNKSFYDGYCGINYDNAEVWTNFFETIAKNIVERFSPKTVLDAGCAYGYLVKALRNLGVDAYGIDISEHAISKADKDIQPFVAAHSITEKLPSDFPKKFDLVITIEVLEHISPEDGKQAIKLLCSYADTIIFTSSPDDIVDRFHLNVQQSEYWAKEFARNCFYRDLIQSAEYICPWAMIFRKGGSFEDVVFNYELNRRIDIALQKKGKPGSGKIYFKCNTWSEENSYSFTYEGSSIDTGKVSVPAGCLELRFDPVKETVCAVISDIMIGSNAGSLPITMGNYDRVINGIYFFPISDPQFNIFLPEGTSWIEIKCTVTLLDGLTEQKIISGLENEIDLVKDENLQLQEEMNVLVSVNEGKFAALKRTFRNETEKLISKYSHDLSDMKLKFDELSEGYTTILNQNVQLRRELDTYKMQLNEADIEKNELQDLVDYWRNFYNIISDAKFWKITAPARKIADGIKKISGRRKDNDTLENNDLVDNFEPLTGKDDQENLHSEYSSREENDRLLEIGLSYNIISNERREREESWIFDRNAKFSVVVPLYNTPVRFLEEMIASVKAQTYSDWELCLADGSDAEHCEVGEFISALIPEDSRIRYKKLEKNMGISENTNACLRMASGNYIALFDHDDILHPSALFEAMEAICNGADFIYTDEAVFISPDLSNITHIHLKPDYAIDNLRANNYICHFTAFDKSLLDIVGGFRNDYDGSQDHDMVLRLTSVAKNVVHIPDILYFWRSHPDSVAQDIGSKSYAVSAGQRAVRDNVESCGYKCEVSSIEACPTIYRIRYEIKAYDKVSIIIPCINRIEYLKNCVDAILDKTTYPNYEIIIADNRLNDGIGGKQDYYNILRADERFVICGVKAEYSHAAMLNYAVSSASGAYYVFLKDNVEIITPDWIEEMLMYAQREDIGAVGAKLYNTDDTIHTAGIVLGMGDTGAAGRAFVGLSASNNGYMGRLCYSQDMSAVTADCMMTRADIFEKAMGFEDEYYFDYWDIDYCLRLRQAGKLVVWTPFSEAYYYELSAPEDTLLPLIYKQKRKDKDLFLARWGDDIERGDPYFNPNFHQERTDFVY